LKIEGTKKKNLLAFLMFLLFGISFIFSSKREGQQDEFRKKIRLLFKYFYKNLSITIRIDISAKSEINKKSTRIRVLFKHLYFVIEFHQ